MRTGSEQTTLSGEAYQIIRQRILRGEVVMGQVISRRKLAAELGMSFLPISEALQRLEFEGLLESRPRAGTRVRIPSRQDVAGHYVLREALEVQSARLFCQAASAEQREELRQLGLRVDGLSGAEASRMEFLELHDRLHRRIAEGARCAALIDAIDKTHALASTWLCVTKADPDNSAPGRHERLVTAVCGTDTEAASEAMRSHIINAREALLKRLEPYFKLQRTRSKTFSRNPKLITLPHPPSPVN
jgi:GntR family transcriptional regulator, rspAB operon transcriptional repressor